MNKHTPGPWTWGRTRGTEKIPEWYITGDVCDVASVSMIMDASRPIREHEANSRLIASAPELLEALESCIEYINIALNAEGDCLGIHHNGATDAVQAAEVAIAKARGL